MSKCKITGKVLAIQLGRQETQLAVIDKSGQILHGETVATPAGAVEDGVIRNVDAVRQMLKDTLKQPGFKGVRQTVFALSTSQVISETVSLPELPEAKLEKLLLANMDMYFPVDVHDYRMVWETIGPRSRDNGTREVEIQLWAVPMTMLDPYYQIANACGLSVAAVDYCGHSIATAVGASFSRRNKAAKQTKSFSLNMEISFGKKTEDVVEVEEENTVGAVTDMHLTMEQDLLSMTFVRNGQVVFQRLIRCGVDPTYQFSEVSMMVEYFRSMEAGRGSEINGIVSGALAENFAMVSELSDMLNMPLSVLPTSYESRWIVCAGAAHTTLDFGNPSLNKVSEARRHVQSKLWQYALVLAAALVLGAVVLFTLAERLGWDAEVNRLESKMQILNIQAQKTAGFADNYNAYSASYDAYESDWNNVFASLQTYNDNLVLVMNELENTMPENTSVTGIQITEEGLMVDFACETKEEAAYLIMALRRLQYADLMDISDLQGGGRGPAKSYGSGEEAPPTEGSSDLSAYLDQVQVVNTLYEIARAEKLDAFTAKNYYSAPATATLTGTRTDAEMKAAIREMLVDNPIAGTLFAEKLAEDSDFYNLNPVLANKIIADSMKLDESGVLSGKPRREQMAITVDEILTKDAVKDKDANGNLYTAHDRMLGVEALIKMDTELQSWYVYYLNKNDSDKYPYLNIENITRELKNNGGFQTADADVNTQLNGLISSSAWDYINSWSDPTLATPTPVPTATPTAKPTATPTAGPSGAPTPTAKPTATPTAKPTATPTAKPTATPTAKPTATPTAKPTATPSPTPGAEDQIGTMLDTYISSKGKEPAQYVPLIENYLLTGSTKHPIYASVLDPELDEYIDSKKADDKIGALYDDYEADADTGIQTVNEVMAKFNERKLENQKIAAAIQRHIDKKGGSSVTPESDKEDIGVPGLTATQLKKLVLPYLRNEKLGNETAETLLHAYFTAGKSGNAAADKALNSYVDAGNINVEISILYNTYVNKKKTDIPVFDEMMANREKNGSTGNTRIDKIIADCSAESPKDEELTDMEAKAKEMLLDYIYNGTTNNQTVDRMIEDYLRTGKSGSEEVDKMLNDYIDNGKFDSEIKALVNKFIMNNGNTGSPVVNELLEKFYRTGSTGNKRIDALIMKAAQIGGGTNDADFDKLISELLGGTNPDGTGEGGEEQDTRVKFTALLGYNDELKSAELIRKGLYTENKVQKLEVGE